MSTARAGAHGALAGDGACSPKMAGDGASRRVEDNENDTLQAAVAGAGAVLGAARGEEVGVCARAGETWPNTLGQAGAWVVAGPRADADRAPGRGEEAGACHPGAAWYGGGGGGG